MQVEVPEAILATDKREIRGSSSIYRCPQTRAQDGRSLGVTYSNEDRLCLDGQRLVNVSSAEYWSDSAEYRTEQESFAGRTGHGVPV